MSTHLNYTYSNKEERLNIISHGFGFLASAIAFPFLIIKSIKYTGWQAASFILFGLSLLILYAASTLYHSAKEPKKRRMLNILDHAAIYVLIAGSYTPFCLVGLQSKLGWYMFIFVWLFACVGIILKLFFTGRFKILSTSMYLFMGWQVVIFIKPLMTAMHSYQLNFLFAGGIFYTVGAILYSIKKIPYNHAIFHVFVLLGSASHFLAIYLL